MTFTSSVCDGTFVVNVKIRLVQCVLTMTHIKRSMRLVKKNSKNAFYEIKSDSRYTLKP